jgi:NADH:ubiquinone oxidoreductase subunit C
MLKSGIIKKIFYKDYKLNVVVLGSSLYHFFFFLKKHTLCQYKSLIDICVSDFPEKKNRFFLGYSLLSLCYNNRMVVLINNSELNGVFSISSLYNSANWAEREV